MPGPGRPGRKPGVKEECPKCGELHPKSTLLLHRNINETGGDCRNRPTPAAKATVAKAPIIKAPTTRSPRPRRKLTSAPLLVDDEYVEELIDEDVPFLLEEGSPRAAARQQSRSSLLQQPPPLEVDNTLCPGCDIAVNAIDAAVEGQTCDCCKRPYHDECLGCDVSTHLPVGLSLVCNWCRALCLRLYAPRLERRAFHEEDGKRCQLALRSIDRNWRAVVVGKQLCIYQIDLTPQIGTVEVTLSINMDIAGPFKIFVHGRELSEDHPLTMKWMQQSFDVATQKHQSPPRFCRLNFHRIVSICREIRNDYNICPGVPEAAFETEKVCSVKYQRPACCTLLVSSVGQVPTSAPQSHKTTSPQKQQQSCMKCKMANVALLNEAVKRAKIANPDLSVVVPRSVNRNQQWGGMSLSPMVSMRGAVIADMTTPLCERPPWLGAPPVSEAAGPSKSVVMDDSATAVPVHGSPEMETPEKQQRLGPSSLALVSNREALTNSEQPATLKIIRKRRAPPEIE